MNHYEASEALERLLRNTSPMKGDVIALTGPWGSGKTHLWHALQKRLDADPTIGNALYASLFGVDALDEIKQRLIQSKLKQAQSGKWDKATHAAKAFAALVPSAQKVLDTLPHALSPFILQDQLLVLDDIERCSPRLPTGALLGFVDEMRTRYGCRLLLVLNDAQLGTDASASWQQLREKVVDHEIVLSPLPEDSWDVAMSDAGIHSESWAQLVRAAVTECGVTNIRVMNKVSLVVTDVLKDYPNLSLDTARRIVSSITFLTAVFYQGIPDAPSLRDLYTDAAPEGTWQRFLKESKLEVSRSAGWATMAQRLGIYGGGALENAIISYLTMGWKKSARLASAIREAIEHTDSSVAALMFHEFLVDNYWMHWLTDAERLARAGEIAGSSHLWDLRTMSQFLFELEQIPGSSKIADSSFRAWQEHNRTAQFPAIEEDAFGRKLHPQMVEYLKEAAPPPASINVYEIFHRINIRDIRFADLEALDALSVEEHVVLISTASRDELRTTFPAMWELRNLQFADGRAPHRRAVDRFINACQTICRDGPQGLSRVVRDQLGLAKPPIVCDISLENQRATQ